MARCDVDLSSRTSRCRHASSKASSSCEADVRQAAGSGLRWICDSCSCVAPLESMLQAVWSAQSLEETMGGTLCFSGICFYQGSLATSVSAASFLFAGISAYLLVTRFQGHKSCGTRQSTFSMHAELADGGPRFADTCHRALLADHRWVPGSSGEKEPTSCFPCFSPSFLEPLHPPCTLEGIIYGPLNPPYIYIPFKGFLELPGPEPLASAATMRASAQLLHAGLRPQRTGIVRCFIW